MTKNIPIRKSDLVAQAFSSNTYFDSCYLHFRSKGCIQYDRLTMSGDKYTTGYHNAMSAVLAQVNLAKTKKKLKGDNLMISIIEEHEPIYDNGRITNEGVTKVGILLMKGKTL